MWVVSKDNVNHVERDFHSTNVKMWELSINFILKCLPSDVPGDDCQIEGDSHYPDYVNCKELSDSQKVGHNLMYASQNPLTHTNSFLNLHSCTIYCFTL